MKNKFLLELQSRGYLNQSTDLDALDEICNKKSISGYIGFDYMEVLILGIVLNISACSSIINVCK